MKEERFHKRRLTGSYITSVISIGLVLLSIGLFGLVLLNAHKLSELIRENIGFEIIMHDTSKEATILALQKQLDESEYVKSTNYITREVATKQLAEDLGEDFIQWLGEEENPLLPSIDVKFNAAWANNDSLMKLEQQLSSNKHIKEIYYQKSLIHLIDQNINRISIILLGFSVLLLIIAIALINNTIRLSIYAKRFLIRSMQLVGATEKFIRKPFLAQAVLQGIIGALIALLLLATLIYFALKNIPELLQLQNQMGILILFASILILGVVLTSFATFLAIRKYLRAKTEELFV